MSRRLTVLAAGLPLVMLACSSSGPPPAASRCDNLRAVNAAVRSGDLDGPTRACIEARIDDPADPDRVALSRLLLWEARSTVDPSQEGPITATWRARAEAHLAIAPDDVEVIASLARVWQRQGPGGAEQALALAERGLQTAARIRASDATILELHKTRTIAAHMLAPPDAPLDKRDRVARFARAWVAAAKARGASTEDPMLACTNAGGTEAFCTGDSDVLRGQPGE